jgi:hypothetical protein
MASTAHPEMIEPLFLFIFTFFPSSAELNARDE